jgi:hypothetical protein
MSNTCDYCSVKFESSECTTWRICPKCLDKECERKRDEVLESVPFDSKSRQAYYRIRDKLETVGQTRKLLCSKMEVELLIARSLVKLENDLLVKGEQDVRAAKRART